MRTARFQRKRKTYDTAGEASGKNGNPKCSRPLLFNIQTEKASDLTEEDFLHHKKTLTEEWNKSSKNKNIIYSLMKETITMRRKENKKKYTERLMFNVTKEYPFLKNGEYVS
jgi:hypothetical protein